MTESAFLQSIRQRDLSGGYYLFGEEEYRLRAALKKAKDMLEQNILAKLGIFRTFALLFLQKNDTLLIWKEHLPS